MVVVYPPTTPYERYGRSGIAALSGILLAVSFPPADAGLLAWVALAPLLFALDGVPWKRGARLGCLCGFVAMLGIGYFTTSFGGDNPILRFLPMILFAGIEALFYALAGAAISAVLARRAPWRTLAGVPAAWLLCEYLRGWGPLGFPFGDIGYAAHANLYLLQLASVGGHWLVGYIVLLGSVALFLLLRGSPRPALAGLSAALAAHLLGAFLHAGAWATWSDVKETVIVSAVQGGAVKTLDGEEEYAAFRRLLAATATIPKQDDLALIVWYESAPFGDLLHDTALRDHVLSALRPSGQPLLTGTRSLDDNGNPGNLAVLVAPDGRIAATYRKRRPVPFGEWVPFRRFLPLAAEYGMPQRDDVPGTDWTVLRHGDIAVGVPICFESAYPDVSRAFVRKGATLLAVLTNDSWFGRTGMMEQHANVAPFRAVETRRWVVRCGRTGVTGFVSPWGRWYERLPVDRAGVARHPVKLETTLTPSVRLGDWVPLACLLTLTWALLRRPAPPATT